MLTGDVTLSSLEHVERELTGVLTERQADDARRHDIKNMLAIVVMYRQLMIESAGEHDEGLIDEAVRVLRTTADFLEQLRARQ